MIAEQRRLRRFKSSSVPILFVLSVVVSCGGGSHSSPSLPPAGNGSCTGTLLTGTLQDSLSGQPVVGARVVLEKGIQTPLAALVNFFPQQTSISDATGAFRMCAASLPTPSLLVVVAQDSTGKAYPPFAASVVGANDFGIVFMGSCRFICGFEGQQQSSTPATIEGKITSTPVAKTGAVFAMTAMDALDGSLKVWSFAMPKLTPAPSSFTTSAGSCPGGAPFCAAYTFTLPSQRPSHRDANGNYMQGSAPPYYSMYATTDGSPSCTPPFAFTSYAEDGITGLTGTPGAYLKASTLNFQGCQ